MEKLKDCSHTVIPSDCLCAASWGCCVWLCCSLFPWPPLGQHCQGADPSGGGLEDSKLVCTVFSYLFLPQNPSPILSGLAQGLLWEWTAGGGQVAYDYCFWQQLGSVLRQSGCITSPWFISALTSHLGCSVVVYVYFKAYSPCLPL